MPGYAADHFSRRYRASHIGSTDRRNISAVPRSRSATNCRCWARSYSGVQLEHRRFSFGAEGDAGRSLDLFADVILNPDFPETDFERQQQLQLAAIANEKGDSAADGLRALPPFFLDRSTRTVFR